jgi:cell division transport system permease protein
MAKFDDKFNKRRLKSSYLTSVISISLVLFILGFFGLILLHSKLISKHVKENIQVSVFMLKNASEAEVMRLKKELEANDKVKYTKYISAEEAKEIYSKEIGEDFITFLDGENPLHASIDVYLNEESIEVASLRAFAADIQKRNIVEEVRFHEDYVEMINQNMARVSLFFMVVTALLLLIAIMLINNTIRLSVYANRFVIRSMQLIGATQGFIRRPFIFKGIIQGIISALITVILLSLVLLKMGESYPDLINYQNSELYLILFGIIFLLGILISWWSSSLAVRRYLRMKIDHLYMS